MENNRNKHIEENGVLPRFTQKPPGFKILHIVSTYDMILWAVSMKKTVATQSQESREEKQKRRGDNIKDKYQNLVYM